MRLDLAQLRQQARDRWPDILMALGIPAEVFTKRRNQPCPACGDGFVLAQHWLGGDFFHAAQAVAQVLNGAKGEPARVAAAPTAHLQRDQRERLAQLWRAARPVKTDDPVGRYLMRRGLSLSTYPRALRYHPALAYWITLHGRPQLLGHFPAMLALVTSPQGINVGLHRTWLTLDGHKAALLHPVSGEALPAKKLALGRSGDLSGEAVRLYPPTDGRLALAEGIETALAVREGSGLPCWAALSAWGLSHAVLPDEITALFVMADNDANQAGQNAARRLARRMQDDGRPVHLLIPERPDSDWLDVLNEQGEPHGQR
ncbi:toprim domain-containing protein [Chromobacterium vaccinii]|uniref:DUF7146 domain-containing protein n=1 Tax=Chromobacterium vaccinii TaxID=1108595 RepID=UPI000697A892|nr:toprim domain-containing protein [Chromobacterium vaccinii]